MRGEIYEADDLAPAVRVSDGRRVRVPAAWLDEASPFAGSYTRPDGDGELEVEEPEVDKPKAKPRARRASDA